MSHMVGSLNHLQDELNAIHRMDLRGVAIQLEMLRRE